MLKFIISMCLFLITTEMFAASNIIQPRIFDPKTVIIIDKPITRNTLKNVYSFLETGLARKDLPNRITIILDSPGGEVYAGFRFTDLMAAAKQQGTSFKCIVTTMAASMAFHILTKCDERVALSGALLLWHRARVMIREGVVTGPDAKKIMDSLASLDVIIFESINATMSKSMPADELLYHFEAETDFTGKTLASKASGFISSTESIDGLFEVMSNSFVVRSVDNQMGRGMGGLTSLESIIYIPNRFLPAFRQYINQ